MSDRTWNAFHRRGEVLRTVVDHVNLRSDGALPMDLPMDLPGVAETFGDELTLVAALQLRWHTRLAGEIDRRLMSYPDDLEAAVLTAWRETASELAGVRAILDRYEARPTSEAMREALTVAQRKDWALLSAQAGLAGVNDPSAARIGRELEARARAVDSAAPPATGAGGPTAPAEPRHRHHGLLCRLKAVLAA
jgi:hypothetical protein